MLVDDLAWDHERGRHLVAVEQVHDPRKPCTEVIVAAGDGARRAQLEGAGPECLSVEVDRERGRATVRPLPHDASWPSKPGQRCTAHRGSSPCARTSGLNASGSESRLNWQRRRLRAMAISSRCLPHPFAMRAAASSVLGGSFRVSPLAARSTSGRGLRDRLPAACARRAGSTPGAVHPVRGWVVTELEQSGTHPRLSRHYARERREACGQPQRAPGSAMAETDMASGSTTWGSGAVRAVFLLAAHGQRCMRSCAA